MRTLAEAVKFLLAHIAATNADPSVAKQATAHHEALNAEIVAPVDKVVEALPQPVKPVAEAHFFGDRK